MITGPDPPLEIRIHVSGPPPQRAQVPLVWIFALVFWPVIVLGWLAWFVITLALTALGITIAAGGVVIWGAGWLIALRWPDAGVDVVAVGRGIAARDGPRGRPDERARAATQMTFEAIVRRYTTLSDESSQQLLPDLEHLHGDWGVLYVEDRDGDHWTLLGDHGFCLQLEHAGRQPVEAPDADVEQLVPWGGRSIPEPLLEEFPFGAFNPVWLIRGWPHEWARLAEVAVGPCPPVDLRPPRVRAGACPAHLIAGREFQRICRRAIRSGRVAPSEEYLGDHDQDHLLIVGRSIGAKVLVMAFPCEGISLANLAQAADGSRGPIVSAEELAPPDDNGVLDLKRGVFLELTVADLDNASPAFVRETWFCAIVTERVKNRFPLS